MNAESVGNYSPISIDQSCFRGLWLYPDISPYGEQKKQDALSKTHLGTHWLLSDDDFALLIALKKDICIDMQISVYGYLHISILHKSMYPKENILLGRLD